MNLHRKLLLKTIGYVALYEGISIIISGYIGYYWNDFLGRSILGASFIIIPILVSYKIFYKKMFEYQESEYNNWLLTNEGKKK